MPCAPAPEPMGFHPLCCPVAALGPSWGALVGTMRIGNLGEDWGDDIGEYCGEDPGEYWVESPGE